MKILFKIISYSLVLLITSKAQSQLSYGIKVGVNGNNVSVDAASNSTEVKTNMKLGLHFGGVLDYKIDENLSLQSGLTLNNKGYKIDLSFLNANSEDVKTEYIATYNYLEIPFNVIFKFKKGLQIFAGPYIGFGTGGREKIFTEVDADTTILKFGNEYNLKPIIGEVTSSDLIEDEVAFNGFAYGLNFSLGFTKGQTSINFIYSLGLSNVLPKSNSRFDKIYNRTLSLSLTYLIKKKQE